MHSVLQTESLLYCRPQVKTCLGMEITKARSSALYSNGANPIEWSSRDPCWSSLQGPLWCEYAPDFLACRPTLLNCRALVPTNWS